MTDDQRAKSLRILADFSPEDIIDELIDCMRLALDLSQSDALVSETTRNARILLSAALVETEIAARQFLRKRAQADPFERLVL